MKTLAKVTLSEAGLYGLRTKVEKLNRRAGRNNLEPIKLIVVDNEHNFDVTIQGVEPRIRGWRLAARVEFNDSIGNVVHVAPGVEGDFTAYRNIGSDCGHCNTSRRRNDVFVLEYSDGQRKVVGRNCLADFLRCGDAESLAIYGEFCETVTNARTGDFEDWGYDAGYGTRVKPEKRLDGFLAVTSLMIRRFGWVSRTKARDDMELTATVENVCHYYFGRGTDHEKWVKRNELYVSDFDKETADKAIEWAKTVDSTYSEYLHNIKRIAEVGSVDIDSLGGYAASIIIAYQNAEAKRIQNEENPKVFLGTAGERLRDQDITVIRISYSEGMYGIKTIVAMESQTPDGKVAPLVWFASGEKEFEVGKQYKLTGTVKEHKTHDRFGPQTVLNRCKLI